MSTYSLHLAHARLEALHALIHALRAADSPAEKRRCATALLNAPDPCEIDEALTPTSPEHTQRAPSVSEREPTAHTPASSPLHNQPEQARDNHANGSTTPAPPPLTPTPPPRAAPTSKSLARTNAQLDEIEQLLSTLESLTPKPSRARSLAARAGQAPLSPAPT